MNSCRHNFLVGSGATAYAEKNGFEIEDISTRDSRRAYQKYKRERKAKTTHKEPSHDTLCLITMDKQGHICAGVSTSGMAFKEPGRVGDSALPGCGLYADDEAGAAAATGDGDQILRFAVSSRVVEAMRCGLHPKAACETVIRQIQVRLRNHSEEMFELGIIAMDRHGNVGGGSSIGVWMDHAVGQWYGGFPMAVWQEDRSRRELEVEICTIPSCLRGGVNHGQAFPSAEIPVRNRAFNPRWRQYLSYNFQHLTDMPRWQLLCIVGLVWLVILECIIWLR